MEDYSAFVADAASSAAAVSAQGSSACNAVGPTADEAVMESGGKNGDEEVVEEEYEPSWQVRQRAKEQLDTDNRALYDLIYKPVSTAVPKRGRQGDKDFEPDGTEAQQGKIDEARAEWTELAGALRYAGIRGLSIGVWRPDYGVVEMLSQKSNHFRSVGHFDKHRQQLVIWLAGRGVVFDGQGRTYEATLLYRWKEKSSVTVLDPASFRVIEVFHLGLPLSLQEGHAILLPTLMRLSVFLTYTHMRRLGYIAMWAGRLPPLEQRRKTKQAEAAANAAAAAAIAKINGGAAKRDGGATDKGAAKGGGQGDASANANANAVLAAPAADVTATTDSAAAVGGGASGGSGGGGSSGWWARLTSAVSATVSTTLWPVMQMVAPESWRPTPDPKQQKQKQHKDHVLVPLLKPENATTFDDVYTSLRTIIPQQVMGEGSRLGVDIYLHRPNHQFKKSAPGPPDFAVCVCEFQEDVPDLAELEQLTLDTRPVDLKFAVVDVGTVTFYELLDLKLTIYADYRHQPVKSNRQKKREEREGRAKLARKEQTQQGGRPAKRSKTSDGDGGAVVLAVTEATADAASSRS